MTNGIRLLILPLFLAIASLQSAPAQAQSDHDEAYDPFADYSEFDEASDEEADIYFFKHGRFLTAGFAIGPRIFTENMASIYGPAATYGVYLSYFFDLRLALMMGFMVSDHKVTIETLPTGSYSGNVSLTALNIDLKYYFNTQNVTRGLADLNPYALGGFTNWDRVYTLQDSDGSDRDSTVGLDLGVGLEIPLMRKKGYLGIQAVYHLISFADESGEYIFDSQKMKRTISGDFIDLVAIIGLNF